MLHSRSFDAYEDLRLYRMGNYPVIRGTALPLGDRSAYLLDVRVCAPFGHVHGRRNADPSWWRCSESSVIYGVSWLT